MEKYRIKQEVYKDGTVKYYPQYYIGWFSGWKSLDRYGQKYLHTNSLFVNSRDVAIEAIDLCEKGVNVVLEITYEYIK